MASPPHGVNPNLKSGVREKFPAYPTGYAILVYKIGRTSTETATQII